MLGKYHDRISEKSRQFEQSYELSPQIASALCEMILDVDDLYTSAKTDVLVRLKQLTASEPQSSSNHREPNAHSQVALKPLAFERFAGDFGKWPNFKAKYVQFFHNNTHMDDLTKFLRLDSVIEKDSPAYHAISGLDRVPSNYSVAWSELEKRYDNPQAIIDAIIDRFIELPAITLSTRDNLIGILNGINHLTGSLQRYETLNVESWDAIIVNLTLRKLDTGTLAAWHHERPQRQIPTLGPLKNFLARYADGSEQRASQAASNRRSNEGAVGYTPTSGNQSGQVNQSQSNANQSGQRMRSHVKVPVRCPFPSCGGEHQLFGCVTFKKLPVDQRIGKVRQLRVCEKCLKPRCHVDRCKLGPCRHCQGNHNGLLCKSNNAPSVMAATGAQA